MQLQVSGHAGSNEPGQDLVCAGVSAIVTGALNAIAEILPQACELICRVGYAEISVKENSEELQTVLKTVMYQLLTVKQEYPKYLKLIEEFQEAKL